MIQQNNLSLVEGCSPYLLKARRLNDQSEPIAKYYQQAQSEWSHVKALISLFNAILSQRLKFFAVDMDLAIKLIEDDPNWITKPRVRRIDVIKAIDAMIRNRMITYAHLGVHEVIDPDVLEAMGLSKDEEDTNLHLVQTIIS